MGPEHSPSSVPRGSQRYLDKTLGKKDRITDSFAIDIARIKRHLGLKFSHLPQERGGQLSAENRLIRNAGILIIDFYSRYFSDEDLRRMKRIGRVQEEDEFGELVDVKTKDWIKLREDLKKGKASQKTTERFILDAQREIPASLAIISDSETCRELLLSPKMPIDELLCLSVIHPKHKPKIVENATAYLLHNGTVGNTVLDILKDYLFKVDTGVYQAVCDDRHVRPLINSGFYVDVAEDKHFTPLRGKDK